MKKSLAMTVQVASHLAYMVLVPLVVFGGAGLYFDRRFDSLPQLLLAGIGISFIVTIYWMSSRLKYIVAALLKEHK